MSLKILLNELNALRMVFLNSNHPDYLYKPFYQQLNSDRGQVIIPSPIKYVFTDQENTITHMLMREISKVIWKMSKCTKLPSELSRV